MKTRLIVVGKTNDKNIIKGIEDYTNRLKHYMPFEIQVIPELKNTKSISSENQKEMEGEQILKTVASSDCLVLLDERGTEYRSVDFAGWIEKKQQVARSLSFVVGGPYGFSKNVYDRADSLISLSKMTFSHQMIRLLFVEQLYRACTIIKGEPYHHE